MDNLAGLSSNAPSYPSFPIKEQLLNVLESKEIELDALLKLLGVELKASHQLKTVHELVNNYEEQNGQISLETWESIFRGLGYSKDFLQVLANFNEKRHCQGTVDLAVANLHTGEDKKNDESGASSNGAAGSSSVLSKKDPGAKPKTNPQFGSLSHDDTSSGPFAALSASVDAEIDTFDKKTAAYSLSSSLLVERPLNKNSSEEDNNGTVDLAVANLHTGEDKKNDESGASSNESPSDDLDSSFPNEKGLLVAVKEEIPQPSKQTALSTCTTGMSQTESDDSGFFAPQNEESQDNDNVDIVKMTFKEKEDLEMRVTSLDEQNKELRMHLDNLNEEKENLEMKVTYLEEQLIGSALSVNSLGEELKRSKARVDSLEKELRDQRLNETFLVKRWRQDSESGNLDELQRMRTKISDLEEENKQLKQSIHAKQKCIENMVGFARKPLPSAPGSVAAPGNDKQCSLPSAPGSVAAPVPCARIKYDDSDVMMLKVALVVASRPVITKQTANLPSVGCVIRRVGHPCLPSFHSFGWNGFLLNTSERDLDAALKNVRIKSPQQKDRVLSSLFGLHAEDKALQYCPESLIGATLYCTHVPCYQCAKRLIHRRIGRVLYLFWLEGCETTIELFKSHDITCTAFGRRDLILEDSILDILTKRGINRGGTNTEKPPEECPSFFSSKDWKQE